MNKKHLGISFVILCICFIFASKSFALTKGFEASSFHPAVDGGPYFTLYGTENLEQWQWVAGTMINYSYQPFQFVQNGVRLRGIIDHDLVQDVHGAVGLVDRWLQLGIDVPVGWWLKYTDPNVATATAESKMAMGDVQLNLKTEFLELKKYKVGIGILPFILLPTGSGKYFNGNGGVSGGGKLLFEFLPVERLRIALNAGILARPDFTITNIEQSNQLLYGLGTAIKITDNFSAEVEASGRAKLKDLFGNKTESPIEGDVGFKYDIGKSGMTIDGGGGLGFIKGSGAPKFRAFLGFAYRSPARVKEVAPKEAPPAAVAPLDDVNKTVVHFSIDNREFATLGDAERLVHAAEILKQHPEAKVQVIGYADSTGTKGHNMALSKRRATIVKNYLVQQGVPAKQLVVVGRGAASPCADNKKAEGRSLNRRVELKVVK